METSHVSSHPHPRRGPAHFPRAGRIGLCLRRRPQRGGLHGHAVLRNLQLGRRKSVGHLEPQLPDPIGDMCHVVTVGVRCLLWLRLGGDSPSLE